jgi:alkanesulfonate monooxygenase SsuD/methylene tetrahydromethanopterin reductase-like flavin-dependent oxidoreductase (luciferase family)
MIPFSILDLSPIVEGGDAGQALRNTIDLAQHAERWGYQRYWLAEHHNIPSVASAATAVVICAVAGNTSTIRVGAGGIMLPNHAPLVIAEQFGTLESLFSGRIDLALGRAPGSDQITARALRRQPSHADTFPQDVLELITYFQASRGQQVRAIPGAGLKIPIWILGSSLYGAQLAAELGLPYAFACANVVIADTDTEAKRLFTSHQQAFVGLRRGTPGPLPAPDAQFTERLSAQEKWEVDQTLSVSFVGTLRSVQASLEEFIGRTQADELILVAQVYDHTARLRSYELAASQTLHRNVVQA